MLWHMTANARHTVRLAPRFLPGVDVIDIVSDRTFPRHAHDQFGIGVMRAGGHASWSNVGPVDAGPGDVIAVSPNEIHDGAPIDGSRAWGMIYLDPSAVAQRIGPEGAAREIAFATVHAPLIANHVGRAILAVTDKDANAADEAITALFADLLAPAPSETNPSPSRGTQDVLARIHDLPAHPPTLDEVAGLMNLTRTAALRRFRHEVGATPYAYALQLRLRMARRALATGLPLVDIAYDLGFADQSHLTRAFARQFGLPPGRLRASHSNIVQDAMGVT